MRQNRAPQLPYGTIRGAWPAGHAPPQMKLRINNCPPSVDTGALFRHFSKFGVVEFIKIENERPGQAILTFSPPPCNATAFFHESHILYDHSRGVPYPLHLTTLEFRNPPIPSPLDNYKTFPTYLSVQPYHLRAGVMTSETELMALRAVDADELKPIVIMSHLRDSPQVKIQFPAIRHGMWQAMEIQANYSNILSVRKANGPGNTRIMLMTFQYPPKVFALHPSESMPDYSTDALKWSRNPRFRRITDIDTDAKRRERAVTTPFRLGHDTFIDPGRWLSWAFTFKRSDFNEMALPKLMDMFSSYNVQITSGPLSTRPPSKGAAIWHAFNEDNHINPAFAFRPTSALQTLQSQTSGFPVLNFETRYALEVCFTKGLLFEGSINGSFLQRLAADHGIILLENLVLADKKLFNPMQLFELPELRQPRKRRVPRTCVLMHSVTITPTTMYVQPVQVEVSNRVIRKFSDLSHRFLRVRFGDEAYYGRLQSTRDEKDTEVYDRVRRTLVNGIKVAGLHYTFLASGNSQFRENGAYFFANTDKVTVNSIRQWMGYFQHIREIPKYVSRIGQCFSTTRAVTSIGITPEITEIPDIKRNDFNFTDGVGKLSNFLAHMISQELRLGPEAPSLFQFRMGGCKGVLAVDPTLNGRAVHIRPSQKKFETDYNQLEIIRWSSFASAYLNRQIILVLSTLGIPDNVFVKKIQVQLEEINQAMEDDETAISMLQANVDFNQVTLAIARMIQAGMRQDPFVDSMLHLWRAWMKKSLKEKANMFVPDGAFLLGCVDETATLRMDEGKLPQIFLQIRDSKNGGKHKIVQGTCIIVRNPALHPGDIRVVEAVDCTDLRHLKDVVVLPQLGERDLANMCAGGDLDGDDFLIMWDPDLIPPEQNVAPMDYSAPPPILSKGPVTQSDIIPFFCDYMKNDSLGTIAVAHRAWADKLTAGVKDEKCIELAQLHSQAVDYPKTGVPARMTKELRVEQYPHWLEKLPHQTYRSNKVLGKLYDEVDRVEFKPSYGQTFDKRILTAFDLPAEHLDKAHALKNEYDVDMRRIMAQFGILTEFEIWSAFVMTHSREIKAYKFAEEIGRLMSAHRHHYRDLVFAELGIKSTDRDFEKLGPFIAAMYKVTADAVAAYKEDQFSRVDSVFDEDEPDNEQHSPIISFPWIFQDELLGIATMSSSKTSLSDAMVQNLLTAKNWRTSGALSGGDRVSSLQHHLDAAPHLSPPKLSSKHATATMTINELTERFGATSLKEDQPPYHPQQQSHSSPSKTKEVAWKIPTDTSSTESSVISPIGDGYKTSRSQSPSSSVSSSQWPAAALAGAPAPSPQQSVRSVSTTVSTETIKPDRTGHNQDMVNFDEEEEVFEPAKLTNAPHKSSAAAFKHLSSLVGGG
ncbi:RNA-dependent RNA polymerase-like protein [Elsinoe fawcettii]|nr:RNA-dependent RNA polymerase-like protein [Elsinoe fawcettii]